MVCNRCIKVLKNEIEAQEIRLIEIELGRVQLDIENEDQLKALENIVINNDFEIIDSAEDRITEQVKIQLLKMLEDLPLDMDGKLSDLLMQKIQANNCNVYLINTGMDAGGQRFDLEYTRNCVKKCILEGDRYTVNDQVLGILENLINN